MNARPKLTSTIRDTQTNAPQSTAPGLERTRGKGRYSVRMLRISTFKHYLWANGYKRPKGNPGAWARECPLTQWPLWPSDPLTAAFLYHQRVRETKPHPKGGAGLALLDWNRLITDETFLCWKLLVNPCFPLSFSPRNRNPEMWVDAWLSGIKSVFPRLPSGCMWPCD